MTKNVFRVLSICSLLLGLMTAASAQSDALRVTIPFDFRVGELPLTGGVYTVRVVGNGQVLQIINSETKQAALSMTNAGYVRDNPRRTSLVFSRYGDVLFLSEVQWEGNRTSRQLLKSKAELEIAKTIRGVRVVAGAR
jgi:hypothetical protein